MHNAASRLSRRQYVTLLSTCFDRPSADATVRRWVNTMVNTACERDDWAFMFVEATVRACEPSTSSLQCQWRRHVSIPCHGVWDAPSSMRTSPSRHSSSLRAM